MYTYFRPFRVINLNPAAKTIFLTVARMNLVRKQKMFGDPIMYIYFRPFRVITLNPAAKANFLTVARMNLVRKWKMFGDPINVYLFSTVLSYHFKSSRKSCFFNRCLDEFGQKAKNVRGPNKCIPIFDCFELKIFQFIFGFPERAFFLT